MKGNLRNFKYIDFMVEALGFKIKPAVFFDSNSFFEQTGELLITGPTHNNLLDIMIMLIESNPTQRETHG